MLCELNTPHSFFLRVLRELCGKIKTIRQFNLQVLEL